MRVMIVDDSGPMRAVLKRCLSKLGVNDFIEAVNGKQALRYFEQEQIDMILSNWNMPGLDGCSLLKRIRQKSSVPFIMVTRESNRERVVQAIEAGVSDYLVKPVSSDRLKEKLDKWIGVCSRL